MATKKPIKKITKVVAKAPAKKVVVKTPVKKVAVKAPAKKVVAKAPVKKAPAKPIAKVAPKKVVAKAPAKKVVAKTPVKKPLVKPVVKKAVVKPVPVIKKKVTVVEKASTIKKVKEISKPVVIKKEKVVKEKIVKEKVKKAPKPEKIKKPVAPVLSAKEIAKNKAIAREALEKELSKKMPEPPPPPIHKRKIEDKNKKPIVIPKVNAKTSKPFHPEFTRSVLDAPLLREKGPLVRYSDTELSEFREIITRKLDAAKRELSYLQGLITRKDNMGGDVEDSHYMTMEDGSMSMEREQLSQMAGRQIVYIDHLEKATMRIENKTYGICRVTGKLIDKARLRAVPHATLSIEAKMRQK
jgi:RNA polymerase-binding transcription factor DksA